MYLLDFNTNLVFCSFVRILRLFFVTNFSLILKQLHRRSWPGWPSRYRGSLRAGRSGIRILLEGLFSTPVQTISGSYLASCTVCTGSLTTRLYLEPNIKGQYRCNCTPIVALRGLLQVELYFSPIKGKLDQAVTLLIQA